MNTSLPESSCWTRFGTDAAKARYEERTEIERQIGGKFLLGSELAHLSDVLRLEGDLAGAIKLADESLCGLVCAVVVAIIFVFLFDTGSLPSHLQ